MKTGKVLGLKKWKSEQIDSTIYNMISDCILHLRL